MDEGPPTIFQSRFLMFDNILHVILWWSRVPILKGWLFTTMTTQISAASLLFGIPAPRFDLVLQVKLTWCSCNLPTGQYYSSFLSKCGCSYEKKTEQSHKKVNILTIRHLYNLSLPSPSEFSHLPNTCRNGNQPKARSSTWHVWRQLVNVPWCKILGHVGQTRRIHKGLF